MRVVIWECEYASFSIENAATLVTNNIVRNDNNDGNFGQLNRSNRLSIVVAVVVVVIDKSYT